MSAVRLGAVSYLNTRPLVYGLETETRFDIRFDVPARCAALLHEGATDVGLIPSIEYLRGGDYRIVPGLSLASRGAVDSVALYTTRDMADVRSIAMDTSSRTSAALVRVLCAKAFHIAPAIETLGPDLLPMLARCDAALIIGDNALFLDERAVRIGRDARGEAGGEGGLRVRKIDLGEAWFQLTGLPFVYAFWAGRPDALGAADIDLLQRARDGGVSHVDGIARRSYPDDPARQAIAARYLRDNMKYHLGADERAGLELFYRYGAEAGVVAGARAPRFY